MFFIFVMLLIAYYVMRSKNGVLCAAAGSLAAERRVCQPVLIWIDFLSMFSSNVQGS
jgi:hypothetical protein